jgi:hypothetical protein
VTSLQQKKIIKDHRSPKKTVTTTPEKTSGRDDMDTIQEAPKRFVDWTCRMRRERTPRENQNGVPGQCTNNDESLRKKLKAAVDSDRNSDSASGDK